MEMGRVKLKSAARVADRQRNAKGPMVLRLYVAGEAPNSARARVNLQRLLIDVDPSRYRVEIIDCLEEPMRALDDGVLVTPTLVRIEPGPQQVVVGTLSALDRVADALEIDAMTLPPGDGAAYG
jgi:circadian clock protein KaiB